MNKEFIKSTGRIEIRHLRLPFLQRKLMQLVYFVGAINFGDYIRDKYGKELSATSVYNTITNGYLAVAAGLLGNTGSQVAFGYLALGTDATAPAATQTALIAETIVSGLTRAAATIDRITTLQTNDTLRLRKTFTSGGTATIQECGFFNDPSSGVMGGRGLTTTKTLGATDTLAIIYTIQFA